MMYDINATTITMTHFLIETMRSRTQWNDICKGLRKKNPESHTQFAMGIFAMSTKIFAMSTTVPQEILKEVFSGWGEMTQVGNLKFERTEADGLKMVKKGVCVCVCVCTCVCVCF